LTWREVALRNDFLAAQLGNAVLAAQAFQYNGDLVCGRETAALCRWMCFTTCLAPSSLTTARRVMSSESRTFKRCGGDIRLSIDRHPEDEDGTAPFRQGNGGWTK
jgi:hypothetical protein